MISLVRALGSYRFIFLFYRHLVFWNRERTLSVVCCITSTRQPSWIFCCDSSQAWSPRRVRMHVSWWVPLKESAFELRYVALYFWGKTTCSWYWKKYMFIFLYRHHYLNILKKDLCELLFLKDLLNVWTWWQTLKLLAAVLHSIFSDYDRFLKVQG